MIDITKAKQLITYDSNTGIFIWRVSTTNKVNVGDVVGTINDKGYLQTRIQGKIVKLHRLAWAFIYGVFPINQLDHEDQDKTNNRISNLRLADAFINARNMPLKCTNKSGFTGVHWNKKNSNWRVQLCINHKRINLGSYTTLNKAISIRKQANIDYGFHPNHGKKK